jgi:hypothetical protein
MLDLPHDVHLVFYLLIQNAVLHEFSFIEFLRRVRLTGKFVCHFVYRGESAPANLAHPVVFVRAGPRPWDPVWAGTFLLPVHLNLSRCNSTISVRV